VTHLTIQSNLSLNNFLFKSSETLELNGITALFGPSGSGKTTLLRILAGLEDRATGFVSYEKEIWQDTKNRTFLPPYARRIGYVFQDGRLFSHLTVEENLRYSCKRAHKNLEKKKIIDFIEAVESLELKNLLRRHPNSLSGGEQQRVAIGRALLQSPQLLLMDEPLSALDLKRKTEIIPYIENVASHFQIPILYVTHNIEEATRLANRMILLSSGRIVASGEIGEILERADLWPLTGRLEAGALLQATVGLTKEGMTHLLIGKEILKIPAVNIQPKTKTRLRVQAKEVAIATELPAHLSIRNILTARLLSIDIEGATFAELLLDVGGQHLRSRVTREAVHELQLKKGQKVYALIKSVSFEGCLFT
jgi:molybdate transport system ATP-binding protein